MRPDLLRALLRSVRTAAVVRVRDYDPVEQTCAVEPIMLEAVTDDEGRRQPVAAVVVDGCPVLWPSAGGRSITWGLADGDLAMALVRTGSHDEVDATGEGGMPAASRAHDWGDAVVLPGYVPPGLGAGSGRSDGQVQVALPGGEALHVGGGAPSYVLVRHDMLQTYLSSLQMWLSGLTLPVSGATAGPPALPPPSPGDLSSSRIAVDG